LVTGRPFTREEHQRIRSAIAEIEQSTAADLDLLVTRVSDRYSLYPIVWAAIAALAATAIVVLLRPTIGSRAALTFQFLILIVLTLIFEIIPIRLVLVPAIVKRAHARQLAHREFAAQYARGGPPRKRILLFVSLGERYVEIIADHQTYAAADPELWNKTVNDFVSAVQAGRIADGVLTAIASCGAVLRAHHPSSPGC
jgi:putative membrane protein